MAEIITCVLMPIAARPCSSLMIALGVDMARTLREIEFETENVKREMAQLVIQQSDIDGRLAFLDRRLVRLEQERIALNTPLS